jgi:hypothetical protein
MISKSLKSLIQEEVLKFINEAPDHADDEIVGRENINLQHEYDKLNQLLFEGKLPRVVLVWDSSKRRLGVVKSLRKRLTGEVKIESLGMSTYYKIPYRKFKDTLAHEMIHVWQIVTVHTAGHGWDFHREARRINGMGLGFNITEKNSEELSVSDQGATNTKELIAIIQEINGEYFLSVTTPKVYETDFNAVVNFYHRGVDGGRFRNVVITVIQSHNPNLLGKRILRSMTRSFSYSLLSDNLLEELLNDKIIKTVNFKRGEPASTIPSNQMAEDIENSGDWEVIEIS